jgi:hypothetical protein
VKRFDILEGVTARRIAFLIVSAGLLAATGCGFLKKKDPPPADSTVAPVVAAPVADTDVPTSEDFEDDAFSKITPANFTTELGELKKEIEAK